MRRGFFLLLLLLARPLLAAPATFDEASHLYETQDYSGARQKYEQLIAEGTLTANVFYNLGNTEFRLHRPGYAALAYQRALLLEPGHREAETNLSLVRSEAGAKALPALPLEVLVLPLSAPVYFSMAAVAFWIAVLTVAALLFFRRTPRTLWLLSAFAALVTAYCAVALWRVSRDRALAVVLVPEAIARLEAADRSGVAETLPAGSDVRVLGEHGAWIYCELPGRGRGWLPQKSIEKIAPSV